jgi:hypothetical protein
VGLITLGPRPCAMRQEGAAWGQQHGAWPLWLAKPGWTRQEPPRRWDGHSGVRRVEGEDADGRRELADRRCLGGPSSPGAPQVAVTAAAAPAQAAAPVAEHRARVAARGFAWAADAAAALAEYASRGHGRRGRKPRPWRSHAFPAQVAAVTQRQKRPQRGRPPRTAPPQATSRDRLRGAAPAPGPSADTPGWPGLAPTVGAERGTDTAILQAYQAHHLTVEPGVRWIQNPATISPVWRAKPARIAA